MKTVFVCLALLACAARAQGADAGLAHSENFIVMASNEALADRILASAEHYRRQVAIDWLGFELPAGEGRSAITAKLDPTKSSGLTWPKRSNSGKLHHVWLNFADPKAVDAMLHHEMVHVVFNTYRDIGLPAWIEEGAASQGDDPERVAIRQRTMATMAETRNWPDLAPLFAAQGISSSDRTSYSVAASLTEFLLTRGDKATFVRFGVTGQNAGWDQALREVYEIDSVRTLAAQWQEWAVRR